MSTRALLLATGLLLVGPAAADPIAVIVHPSSPVRNLTSEELKAAFQGYGLPGVKEQITLVYLRGDLEDAFNHAALGLSSKQVKVYWLKRVFEGESDARRICKSADEVKDYVRQNPASIGFVPVADLDGSVRAVTVDAAAPGDPSYPVK